MSLGLLVAALLLLNSSANSQVTVPLNDTQPFTDSLLQNSVNHYFFERTSISLNDLLPASQLTPSTQTSTFVSTSVQSNSVSSPSSAARQPSTINASASSGKHHGTGKHNKRAGSIDPSGTWNLFVTLTTCSQPVGGSGSPGPLQLFVSTNARNTLPGPSAPSDAQTSGDPSKGNGTLAGFLDVTMLSLSLAQIKNVWIGVSAPQLQGQGWTGNWTYQLGVSTKAPMHVVLPPQTPPPIALDDTDITSALFLTRNYTDTSSPNWKLVITTDGPPTALSLSLCAAERYQVLLTPNVTITKRGPMLGNKQQAYVKGLVPGKNYSAYYVISNQAGVGSISQPVKFRTKTVANCRLIYNLQFCDQVAYSVPAPVPLDPITLDLNNLTVSYDQQAKNIFKPFEVAINQFDCTVVVRRHHPAVHGRAYRCGLASCAGQHIAEPLDRCHAIARRVDRAAALHRPVLLRRAELPAVREFCVPAAAGAGSGAAAVWVLERWGE
ncbi:stretch-activated Ca2+-permeable channel component-domain-containing protein [Jimgerdemannia flammicorona]|uniref:Stretch-activated Ca2+-permeable channel component-domain-containing protein n=1 Tax=Jimgerdemannia flammicorona TaxID=994334 RepID=A0A433CVV4_9FUNG|nr:stretch-activated Ca2+-permeable channel component-domain-containing protein [Jimgerdemannia flammicorona]